MSKVYFTFLSNYSPTDHDILGNFDNFLFTKPEILYIVIHPKNICVIYAVNYANNLINERQKQYKKCLRLLVRGIFYSCTVAVFMNQSGPCQVVVNLVSQCQNKHSTNISVGSGL